MKVVSLTAGGATVLPRKNAEGAPGAFAADRMTTEATARGFVVVAEQDRLFRSTLRRVVEFPFQGSTVERLDASRSLAGGAIGAVAGTLLLGPLGLVAGGLLGAKKRILYTVSRGTDIALLELSSSEEKTLIGRGFAQGAQGFPLGAPSPGKGTPVQRYCVTCGAEGLAHVPNGLFGTKRPADGEAVCAACSGRC